MSLELNVYTMHALIAVMMFELLNNKHEEKSFCESMLRGKPHMMMWLHVLQTVNLSRGMFINV